jgi:hypothetical protein
LAIWLVIRGNSLLPWHGVGVIQQSGKWGVALARDVLSNASYQPVFLGTEDVPFFYRQVAKSVENGDRDAPSVSSRVIRNPESCSNLFS